MNTSLSFRDLTGTQRSAVELMLLASGVFQLAEIDVALEVFDAYTTQPHRDYSFIGGFDDEELIAFACYGPTPCTVGTWDFYWVAVAPDQQHRGIGTMMLREVERRVSIATPRMMVVETSGGHPYEAARALYERNGYEMVSRIPDFYAPGDDQVVYVKRFRS